MALSVNWLETVAAKLGCKDNTLTSLQLRKYIVGTNLERLLEIDPSALDIPESGLKGFSLVTLLGQIKCGVNSITDYELTLAESVIAQKMLTLSEINPLTVYGAGTAYSLTATPAAVDLGTTDPVIVLNKAGKYRISARVQIRFNGATFAASRDVVTKLRRTNNTPADIANSSTTLPTGIVTTQTGLFEVFNLPEVFYETALDDDSITLFSSVSTLPSAGSIQVVEASIFAQRVGI